MAKDKLEDKPKQKESMIVEIAFPECVHIELVQSNDLKNYEIFLWLASLFASAATGFWTALATTSSNKVLWSTSITFSLFTLAFGSTSWYYRTKMNGTKITKITKIKDFDS